MCEANYSESEFESYVGVFTLSEMSTRCLSPKQRGFVNYKVKGAAFANV